MNGTTEKSEPGRQEIDAGDRPVPGETRGDVRRRPPHVAEGAA